MMASGEIRLSTMTMRQMPVLAQSQDQMQSAGAAQSQLAASIPQASAPADYQIDTPISVIGTGAPGDSGASNASDSSGQLGEIIVVGNQGERGWQGNNPDPTKGVQPIRDSNGKITGWSVRNPQTGKRTGKSLEWGRQNGLDPNNFFSPDGPVPALPPAFGIPSLNPWWWLLFSAPAQ